MRVIVTGGGTGGHIYPALSIGERLASDGAELLYVGCAGSMEEGLAAQAGLDFAPVKARPLERTAALPLALLTDYLGMLSARRLIRAWKPDLVVGTGGYASWPAVRAAQTLGCPTLLHEQNVFPGLANRKLARKADAICLTFAEAGKLLPDQSKLHHTGLPIRANIITATREQAREYFDLRPDDQTPTVLVTGGSQGAATLNQALVQAAPLLLEQGIRLIVSSGQDDFFSLRQRLPQHPLLILKPYISEMALALALADVAVGRAGASFLSETAAIGLPTVLVPYPHAANDHQRYNARLYQEAGAALTREDDELDGEWLAQTLPELVHDRQRLARMGERARSLGVTDAADRIARAAYRLIGFEPN